MVSVPKSKTRKGVPSMPDMLDIYKSPTEAPIPKSLDIFTAAMIVDGADGYEVETEAEYAEALQVLIDSGVAWQLQGRVGRTARDFIEAGLCTA